MRDAVRQKLNLVLLDIRRIVDVPDGLGDVGVRALDVNDPSRPSKNARNISDDQRDQQGHTRPNPPIHFYSPFSIIHAIMIKTLNPTSSVSKIETETAVFVII